MSFNQNMTWGVAAASYQIEGAFDEDGKGLSVWDMAVRKPGFVYEGHTGDVACDHYHRYAQDVAMMKAMGVHAYRLSISWPRVLPSGVGTVNEKGLAFYDKLVDALLGAGIQPWVTLFHWDFPVELYRRGGWLNRKSVEWFAEYTQVVVERLSDRVSHWITLNEPQCFIGLGLQTGVHAPGDKLQLHEVLLAGHHALMAHGRACQVIREHAKTPPKVGYAPVGVASYPATESPEDVDAARAHMFGTHGKQMFTNTLFADPVILGGYPKDVVELYGPDFPRVCDADLELIKQPADFYGVNIYQGTPVSAGRDARLSTHGPSHEHAPEPGGFAAGYAKTNMNWPVTPEALYWGPRFFHERYKLPVVITENGMANLDWVMADGKVHDPQRIDYLNRYLSALKRAAADGVPVDGYFQWSIMDNFEWAEGYNKRFGLVHVDYETQVRTPKDSAEWYSEVIRTNGGNLTA